MANSPIALLAALVLAACAPESGPAERSTGAEPENELHTAVSSGSSAKTAAVPPQKVRGLTTHEALSRVRDLELVKRELARDPGLRVVMKKPLTELPTWYAFEVRPEEPDEALDDLDLRVNVRSGEVQVESLCEDGGWVAVTRREAEARAMSKVVTLPEFRGFAEQLRASSRGKVWMVMRIEACAAKELDEVQLYVGERHDTHTVRSFTVKVSGPDAEVLVADLGSNDFTPYAAWRATPRARLYARMAPPPSPAKSSK